MSATRLITPGNPRARRALFALAYLAAFVALDWASYIRPLHGLNITPWNPQPALAVALLMWDGRLVWLVWAGLVAAEVVVRGLPANPPAAIIATLALALSYAAMGRILRSRIGTVAPFSTRAHLAWFSVTVVLGSLVSGLVYVAAFASMLPAGSAPALTEPGAIARYWIGDAVGLIVTMPVLASIADERRRAALAGCLRDIEWWTAAAATCACLWLVFSAGEEGYFKYFYVLLLPVVWSSARFGFPGAVLSSAFTQLGLLGAAQVALRHDLTLFELQALMAVLTLTALLVGVLVDERTQVANELRNSLRLAAAGQMAAALAHELSQPLTAVSNYAAACKALVGPPELDQDRRRQLTQTVQALSAEAVRAGDVIKRLRDFFRSGATDLVNVAPVKLLVDAVAAQRDYAERRGVQLSCEIPSDLPPAWLDPVQIAVVVRNLLANAIEAAADAPVRQVHASARATPDAIVVEVSDSGPGVDPARRQTLFDPAPSSKEDGLGIGLSICRAIVEAHGGTLWTGNGPGGRFLFTLPVGDHGARQSDSAS